MDIDQNEGANEPNLGQQNQPSLKVHGSDNLTLSTTSCKNLKANPSDCHAGRCRELLEILLADLTAADFKWSMFVAAASSYKFDSCLRPFPSQFIRDTEKDIDGLRLVIDETPPFQSLVEQLKKGTYLRTENVKILLWVLQNQEPKLTTVPKQNHKEVLCQAPSKMAVQEPNLIFKVMSRSNEERWNQWQNKLGTLSAYHGSRLENFHSILKYGLQQHLNKTALFGAGIYLSSELGVSMPYSKFGSSWSDSTLGNQISCVALCQILNHPDVKCHQGDSPEEVKHRSTSRDSMAGAIPAKYVLVRNSDHVRVCYLLVYCKPTSFNCTESAMSSTMSWVGKHKLLVLLMAYIFLLIAIGIGNSHSTKRAIRQAFKGLWS
ncbi:protein mono-ADP-ribosyltransferase PARP16 isoform X1 [Neocloeon triangulifer]|uniref:protein mono-ADP-ribosyltransferase PARP16 isoform X1 n=1 Tax=Neocloeon triangulifer TaxID=2078957 RepID=UPI00286EED83|nr:protein mono-ADP-ribosyltransferase PARP16 isoform X1 [Neocloeon triangulifer]XP_059479001.1 protein mono-ADP-ribosyltransferase PARP16 isoform X1 [Neocloeon triangulifer]XP_059479002.1 protein mono-ADP-ribosyltransferase PARP16 isoform X1 [Neocloeon triangulifer]